MRPPAEPQGESSETSLGAPIGSGASGASGGKTQSSCRALDHSAFCASGTAGEGLDAGFSACLRPPISRFQIDVRFGFDEGSDDPPNLEREQTHLLLPDRCALALDSGVAGEVGRRERRWISFFQIEDLSAIAYIPATRSSPSPTA